MESIPELPKDFAVTPLTQENENTIILRFHMKHIQGFMERAKRLNQYFNQYPVISLDLSKKKVAVFDCGLSDCDELQKRIIFINDLVTERINVYSLKTLVEALASNKPIINLNLSSNKITDETIKFIAEGLFSNNHLKQLYLKGNLITDYGIRHLSESLKYNNSIKVLDLNNNPFTVIGVRFIAQGVKCNNSLEKLGIKNKELNIFRIKPIVKLQYTKRNLEIDLL